MAKGKAFKVWALLDSYGQLADLRMFSTKRTAKDGSWSPIERVARATLVLSPSKGKKGKKNSALSPR